MSGGGLCLVRQGAWSGRSEGRYSGALAGVTSEVSQVCQGVYPVESVGWQRGVSVGMVRRVRGA